MARLSLSCTGTLRSALLIAAALVPLGCDAPEPRPFADTATVRRPPAGEVIGFHGRYDAHVWRRLPYAAPPVGTRRWRAPVPPKPWQGTREAIEPGHPCPQFTSRFGGIDGPPGSIAGSEDCLTLDVYAPAFAPEEVPAPGAGLPVMVWIHGGGNVVGTKSLYDGGRLASEQGLVVVALNYRLGPLGWFRHGALRAGASPAEASGNFGTLDLIRGLQWVQENIAAFGGDPGRVTIFGESAGGRNVFSLLVSPEAAGLFHGAIAQSGRAVLLAPERGESGLPNSSEVIVERLLGPGTSNTRPEELAAPLRGVPVAQLFEVYSREADEGLIDVPQLFADGTVLHAEPVLDRLATPGGYNAVPVVLGTNRDENRVFLFSQPRYVQMLLGVYPRVRNLALFESTANALSDAWKVIGADAPAAALASHGRTPTWVYRFDWDEEASRLGVDLGRLLGASHGFEIPFVFGHFELGEASIVFDEANAPAREALSARMRSYWAEFAASGNPGRGRDGSLPEWQPWAAQQPRFLVLDTDTDPDGGVRMARGEQTLDAVVARVKAEASLDEAERCEVLFELARWSRTRAGEPPEARYAELSGPDCQSPAPVAAGR